MEYLNHDDNVIIMEGKIDKRNKLNDLERVKNV